MADANRDAITRIEESLQVKLPDDYKALLSLYLHAGGPFADEPMLMTDSQEVIRANQYCCEFVPEGYFEIGHDGGEIQYYIDLNKENSPVFAFDLETRRVSEEAVNLSEYAERCRLTAEAMSHAGQKMPSRPWWRSWSR